MAQKISLKEAEQKVFSTAYNDGLWDFFLGCFFLIFAVGPILSVYLGDFWSSFVFLPFWGIVYLAVWLVRKYVIAPRMGLVKFGNTRKKKMMRLSLVFFAVNVIALILGFIFASSFGLLPRFLPTFTLSLILLIGFSLAAYILNFNRLYIYGILVGFSPLVGEWLFTHANASHHGLPITFGVSSGIMILIGLILFIRFLHNSPIPAAVIPPEGT